MNQTQRPSMEETLLATRATLRSPKQRIGDRAGEPIQFLLPLPSRYGRSEALLPIKGRERASRDLPGTKARSLLALRDSSSRGVPALRRSKPCQSALAPALTGCGLGPCLHFLLVPKRFVDDWQAHNPGGTVIHHDLNASRIPYMNSDCIAGVYAPSGVERTPPEMQKALALSAVLIAERQAADVLLHQHAD